MTTSLDEALSSRSAGRRLNGARPFGGLLRWLAEAYRVRKTELELYELDERMLRDIGLTRTEIPHLARHGHAGRLSRSQD